MRLLFENPLKSFSEQQIAQGKRQASEKQEVHFGILDSKAEREASVAVMSQGILTTPFSLFGFVTSSPVARISFYQ